MPNNNCLFCQIAAGQVPCHEVWSNATHLAFLSIFPNTDGVTVVIPREHYSSYLFEQDDEVIAAQILATKQVARLLDRYYDDVSRCGLVFEGFGIDHLHSKLYPLHGTGNLTEWQPIESAQRHQFFPKYPGYITSNDAERADDAQLAELAKNIRALDQA